MSKKIVSSCDFKTNCIRKTTNKTTLVIGYSLSQAPSADVTVAIAISNGKLTRSPVSLTFTVLNWYVRQEVTFTGVNDGITDIIVPETITLTASGGGYDGVSLVQDGFVYDTITGTFYYGYFGSPAWFDFYSLTNGFSATKTSIINYIFNGNGIPSGYATNTILSTSYSGTMHTTNTAFLVGATSVTQGRITWADIDGFTWTYYYYIIFAAATPGTEMLYQNEGHAAGNDIGMINAALAAGIDVAYFSMPVCGQNTTNNPTVPGTSTAGHNQMLTGGLDRVGYSPFELFFVDKAIAKNYIDATFPSYTSKYGVGLSGGGWSITLVGCMFEDITVTCCVRGVMPQKLKSAAGDYEQGDSLATSGARVYTNLYRTIASISDFVVQCCTGGRTYKTITNTYDSTIGYVIWRFVYDKFVAVATQAGGTYKQNISTNAGEATHQYNATDIAQVMNEL